MKDRSIFDSLLKQKDEKEKAINNLLKALEMGIFTPSTKQRLEELAKTNKDIKREILLQKIFEARSMTSELVYDYFCTFKDLDYSIQKNRERLIEMFIRKVIISDDKTEPTIYYNISNNNSDIKENAETETGFGFNAVAGESGISSHSRFARRQAGAA